MNIFPNLFDSVDPETMANICLMMVPTLKYVVWWPNPNLVDNNQGYYLIIREESGWTRSVNSQNPNEYHNVCTFQPEGKLTPVPDGGILRLLQCNRDVAYLDSSRIFYTDT